ncbi:MAG: hypothetical protein KAV82_11885 [Phycisphaerae bacterium]|nr:hypothetical protein [Phycisphaerae bacterium]
MPLRTSDAEDPSRRHGGLRGDDIPGICAALRGVIESQDGGEVAQPRDDPRRDRLLVDYRRVLLACVHHDAKVNRADLNTLLEETSTRCGLDPARTALGANLGSRLDQGLARITQINPYHDGKSELKWFLALTQFYLDGLFLADRLLTARPGESGRRWRLPRRRVDFLGFSSPGFGPALITALETAVPDIFRVNPFDTYMPLLLHLLAHQVFPGKRFSFSDTFATTFGWIHRGGFGKLRGVKGEVARFEGLEHLHNSELFDLSTHRTRHNVIIAASHRLGYLDWPLFFEPLRKVRFAVWANNAFFGPAVEKKIARDRYSIPIRGHHAPPLEVALVQTADVLIHAKVPVFIMVDGGQPPLFYGQQMRVKRGIRLAVNETIRRARGTGRRTYVLPLSLNDPVGFVQGREDVMRVTFHPPVLVESVVEPRRPTSAGGVSTGDSGDPLINHLEALFLLETTHAVRGLPRPRIVAAARRRLRNRSLEPLLKRWFQTSIADLARQAAQDCDASEGNMA